MKKTITLLSFALILFSCQDIDDEILPILGVYDAHVVGINGPFSINVSAAGNDDILIDAPFDGEFWSVVRADIDETDRLKWDIDIYRQSIAPGVEIWGDGFYYDGTLQLAYTMQFFGENFDYRMLAQQ
jgi:hypothetical protein